MISDPCVRQALGNDRAAWLFVPWPRDSRVLQRAFTMRVFRTATMRQSRRQLRALNRLKSATKTGSYEHPRGTEKSGKQSVRTGGIPSNGKSRNSIEKAHSSLLRGAALVTASLRWEGGPSISTKIGVRNRGVVTRTKNPCAGGPLNSEIEIKAIKRDAPLHAGRGVPSKSTDIRARNRTGLIQGFFFQAASFGDGALVQRRRSFNHFKPANEVRVESERRSCICFRRALPGGGTSRFVRLRISDRRPVTQSSTAVSENFFSVLSRLASPRGGQHQHQRSVDRARRSENCREIQGGGG
jgi:hypothetical protein